VRKIKKQAGFFIFINTSKPIKFRRFLNGENLDRLAGFQPAAILGAPI
jgi:hypothetical protein